MGQSARSLLSEEQFAAVCSTIRTDNPDVEADDASVILEEALAFVAACATFPAARLVPSRVVDAGWHALILHTQVYAELCGRLGAFIHHRPEEPDPTRYDQDIMDRTMALIEEAGYSVDVDLWGPPDGELVSVAAQCQHSEPRERPIIIQPKPKG
ncbi:glycine-rich domain-containing protein [Streptomyces sp. NPDC015125]|uniref:glycine-rich domain-containing protein n=1 Tax=Streptomyces sp. NPDC015125 TaxID=3364938 RepID=UPI003700D4F1